jgi:ribosomal protein L7/L12
MNYYSKAIDVLSKTTDNLVIKELLFEVAKINPATLCKAYDSLHKIEEPRWIKQAKIFYPGEGGTSSLIEAIKLIRSKTDCGLIEAKDFVSNGYKNPEKYGIKY